MSDSLPAEELRRSVSLLATEWWLLVGGLFGYLLFGLWVVATGLALEPVALSSTVTSVGGTAVTTATVVAVVLWLLVPAVVVTWLFERRLANPHGNLLSHYRIEHPGVLPALPGAAMLVFAVVAVAVGPLAPVVAFGAVASTHLFVRTVAYGRRVYSFSPRPLFTLLTGISAAALAAGWVVHAPGLPGAAGRQVTGAGVGAVVDTGTAIAGTTPATALGVLVAIPAALSGAYLLIQSVSARRVRSRAPLANPDKRAEQRFPIMPPVPASERPGAAVSTGPPTNERVDDGTDDEEVDEPAEPAEPAEEPAEPAEPAETSESTDDGTSHTRVFTADEPIPDGDEATTQLADATDDDDEEDGWIDDTAVFSPDRGSGDSGDCAACGETLPSDSSVTFCPNCGQKI